MPQLILFLLKNFAIGAAIGSGLFAALLASHADPVSAVLQAGEQRLLAAALMLYAMASTFGLGYLSTALALIDADRD